MGSRTIWSQTPVSFCYFPKIARSGNLGSSFPGQVPRSLHGDQLTLKDSGVINPPGTSESKVLSRPY